tara:strand:- start:6468 stop:6998 length:531 start_codon:yes stop_codon:yes gene_type:complete
MITDILIKHTQAMFDETSVNLAQFSESLFLKLEESGCVVYDNHRQNYQEREKWVKSQMNRFTRIMRGETPLNANFIQTWLTLLLPIYQEKARQEILSFCFGVLDVKIPEVEEKVLSPPALSDLIRSFSQVIDAAGPILDGIQDAHKLNTFVNQCEISASKLLGEAEKIKSIPQNEM